jgi:hypothetical protein
MAAEQKIEPELMVQLKKLPPDATLTVLVFARADPTRLRAQLVAEQAGGRLRFNALPLADCFAVEANPATIAALEQWTSVEAIRANPAVSI